MNALPYNVFRIEAVLRAPRTDFSRVVEESEVEGEGSFRHRD